METLDLGFCSKDFVFTVNEKKVATGRNQTTDTSFYGWKSSTLPHKPNCITPELWYFYLFNLEAVV